MAATGRHNNRGHGRLWRATPTTREKVSPLLHMMRYTQGFTTLIVGLGVLWHAGAEPVYFVMGALATSAAAKTLKTWIRDPRPDGTAVTRTYGMPSTHSATVTFMSTYVLFYTGSKVAQSGLSSLSAWEVGYSAFLVVAPVAVMWSRTALMAHTAKQVLAGGALGVVVANGAWHLWNVKDTLGGDALKDRPHIRAWDGHIVKLKAAVVGVLRTVFASLRQHRRLHKKKIPSPTPQQPHKAPTPRLQLHRLQNPHTLHGLSSLGSTHLCPLTTPPARVMASSQQTNGMASQAVASTSAPASNATATGKPAVQPSEVGWLFVPQYYTFLNQNPGRLHCFYTKKSTLIHGTEQETEKPCFGQQEIHDKISSMGFEDCKVYVSNVDSQSSASGGIIIQVLGEMSNKNGPWRKFSQTFFLAEQPNGYFVLNDIFRYLKNEEETEEQAEEVEEDVRHDEEDAREEHRDVAGVKVDISAITQPGATPRVPSVIAASESQPAAIAAAPQDNSVTEVEEQPVEAQSAAASQEASAAAEAQDASEPSVVIPAAAQADTTQADETVTPTTAATDAAASAAPAAPVEQEKPSGPPKPKTWANLAASNATTWGSAVRADAKGVSAAAAPAPAQTSARPSAGPRAQGQAAGGAGGSAAAQPGAVFIKNVQPEHVSESALRSTLEKSYGPLKDLQVISTRGCAFATFSNPEHAKRAISASSSGGVVVGDKGWKVSIEEKRNRPQGDRAPATGPGAGGRGGKTGGAAGRGGARGATRGAKPAQA
ncbi:unnamed protein product [Parajaminaea phylloscopi]